MQLMFAFALVLSPVVVPEITTAQGLTIDDVADGCDQVGGLRCNEGSVTDLFYQIIQWALAIAFIVAVIILIYGGFLYITSAGNQDTATKGKNAIVNALIGIVVIVLSYMIIQIVYRFLIDQ